MGGDDKLITVGKLSLYNSRLCTNLGVDAPTGGYKAPDKLGSASSVGGGLDELYGKVGACVTKTDAASTYLTKTDASKTYVKQSTGSNTAINVDKNGAMANFSDNGQAYLAVRAKTDKFIINSPYAAASFGVKDDGTSAFSHKTYTTYNSSTGAYTGARNTAVLQFAGPTGLRYAKNSGTGNDVMQDMYKYVGVIDSPDEFQRVYSAKQVDDIIAPLIARIEALEALVGGEQSQNS